MNVNWHDVGYHGAPVVFSALIGAGYFFATYVIAGVGMPWAMFDAIVSGVCCWWAVHT